METPIYAAIDPNFHPGTSFRRVDCVRYIPVLVSGSQRDKGLEEAFRIFSKNYATHDPHL